MLVFVDAGGGGWLPPVGGAGGMRPAVLQVGGVKREERVGGRAAPPMLCWLAALPRWLPRG